MKQLIIAVLFIAVATTYSCKKNKDDPAPNPNIIYESVNETLKTYTPKPAPTDRFEYIGSISASVPKLAIGILMSWETSPNGIYLHPNNSAGAILTNTHGLIKGMPAGVAINSASISWNTSSPAISYDYVTNSTSSKGDFAGKGNLYIGFYTIDSDKKYYGWAQLNVSADGRTVKLIDYAVQKVPDTGIKTGEK